MLAGIWMTLMFVESTHLVEKLNQLNKQGMDSYDSEDMEIWAIIETIAYD